MRRTSTDLCTEIRTQIEGEEGTDYEVSVLRAWTAWKVSLALTDTFGAVSVSYVNRQTRSYNATAKFWTYGVGSGLLYDAED
jgi:hypothetical protein